MKFATVAFAIASLTALGCTGAPPTSSPTPSVTSAPATSVATALPSPGQHGPPSPQPRPTPRPLPSLTLGLFREPVDLAVPGDPGFDSQTVGDFNGDGNVDIASSNGDGSISVLLGEGHGTFAAPTDIPESEGPAAIGAADLNGDGNLDLVVAHSGITDNGSGPDDIVVLLGKGDGTFHKRVVPAGVNAQALVIADFNGDTTPDLATANDGEQLSIFIGMGDGTFEDPLGYAIGARFASRSAAADFNGDGDLDLVTTNSLVGRGQSDKTVSVLLGRGDGSFGAPATFPSGGPQPIFPVVADLNGDGAIDVAIPEGYPSKNVGVLLGLGNGVLAPVVLYPTGWNPHTIAVADFDGDGYLDLASGNLGDNGGPIGRGIAILFGSADGTFEYPALVTDPDADTDTHASSSIAVVADLDGDGRTDLVAINYLTLTVLFNAITR